MVLNEKVFGQAILKIKLEKGCQAIITLKMGVKTILTIERS